MKIIDRMLHIMNEKGIRPIDIANHLGVTKSVVSNWKSRGTNPPSEYIEPICVLLGVSPEYLLTGKNSTANGKVISLYNKEGIRVHLDYHIDDDGIEILENLERLNPDTLKLLKKYIKFLVFEQNGYPLESSTKQLDVLGYTAAGEPIEIQNGAYSFSDLTTVPAGVKADFALRVRGNSMEPKIMHDDIILIKKQPVAETGQIIIASVNNSVTCKKYYHYDNRIELKSINPSYPPIVIYANDNVDFEIIGVVLL